MEKISKKTLTWGFVAMTVVAGVSIVAWNNNSNLIKAIKKANPSASLTGLTAKQIALWNSYKVA